MIALELSEAHIRADVSGLVAHYQYRHGADLVLGHQDGDLLVGGDGRPRTALNAGE